MALLTAEEKVAFLRRRGWDEKLPAQERKLLEEAWTDEAINKAMSLTPA